MPASVWSEQAETRKARISRCLSQPVGNEKIRGTNYSRKGVKGGMDEAAIVWNAISILDHCEGKNKDQTLHKEGLAMHLKAIEQGMGTSSNWKAIGKDIIEGC